MAQGIEIHDGANRNNEVDFSSTPLGHCQNDLADVAFFTEDLLCSGNLAQGIGFGNERLDFLSLDPLDKVSENLRFKDSAAKKTQVLEVERSNI